MRPLIFWPHLTVAVLAGLFIFLLSATGLLLAYERQIVEWAEQRYAVEDVDSRPPLTADELIAIGKRGAPGADNLELRFVNRPGSPVTIRVGGEVVLVNPYTGEVLREGDGAIAEFFDDVTRLHRWLAVEGEGHDAARATIAFSNLLFLFLMISGIYLWLPRAWNWPILKTRMFFNRRANNAKARNFNWHHVFSFWALVPLLLICLTAIVFYFPWAESALYAAFGEEAPERGRGDRVELPEPADSGMTRQALKEAAIRHAEQHDAADWYSISLESSAEPHDPVVFYIDRSIGHRPPLAYDLTLHGADGSVLDYMRNEDYSPGTRARVFVRYLHTGEIFGIAGQTVAGLASLAACFLVYTGLALAWRRLVVPLRN